MLLFHFFRDIKARIDAIINQAQGDEDGVTEEILIPGDKVGLIIGKGGETIRNMQVIVIDIFTLLSFSFWLLHMQGSL